MLIIEHRCNNSELLRAVPVEFGCEIDIRNHGKRLVVIHDPFREDGEDLEQWVKSFNHKFLILNVKEEGLEEGILRILKNRGISDFFILDESFPFIRKWAMNGIKEFAVRVSEYENSRTALNLALYLQKNNRKIGWIWADCFEGTPLSTSEINSLKRCGYKICYASPELHCLSNPELWDDLVSKFISGLIAQRVMPDAVCTKLPQAWKEVIPQFLGM
jgi:hypothetical protein